MYHQISHKPEALYPLHSLEPSVFALQMKVLNILGYNTINLDQLYKYRNGLAGIPNNPIVITFDDGYQDSVNNSVSILQSYGFTATYYIPTDYIGEKSSWLMPELGFELPIVNWEQIKRLDSIGIQIGCHSMSHPRLDTLSPEECNNELSISKNLLEDKLGHEVNHLAYPYGSYNESVVSSASEAGFLTACTTQAGLCKPKYSSYTLPRINIGYKDSIIDFIAKIHTGFSPKRGAQILISNILAKIGIGNSNL